MLTKALRPLPEKWHGLQDPDLQQRRRYLHLIADDAPRRYVARARPCCGRSPRARRARLRRGREARCCSRSPAARTRRPFTTHHNALDIDLKLRISLELLPQAAAGRRPRARLRARPQLPQRGHRPRAQPRVHDARGLPGLRRLRDDDGAHRGRSSRECATAVNRSRPRPRRSHVPRAASSTSTPPFAGITVLGAVSEATGEDGHARAPEPRASSPSATTCRSTRRGDRARSSQELFEKLVEQTICGAHVRLRLPAGGLAARAAAPRRPGAHRALRPRGRRRSSSSRRSRELTDPTSSGRSSSCSRRAASGRRRGGPSARRGLPARARARHAARRAASGSGIDRLLMVLHGRPEPARPDHVPASQRPE